jgi:hypothetical protein
VELFVVGCQLVRQRGCGVFEAEQVLTVLLGLCQHHDRCRDVLADVLVALALACIVEGLGEERDQWRDHAAFRGHAHFKAPISPALPCELAGLCLRLCAHPHRGRALAAYVVQELLHVALVARRRLAFARGMRHDWPP